MVKRVDKQKRGVGFQGFKYAPGVVEFAHIVSIHSPRAYRTIRHVLQLPTERSHQYANLNFTETWSHGLILL
jgi:hypothetical protein